MTAIVKSLRPEGGGLLISNDIRFKTIAEAYCYC